MSSDHFGDHIGDSCAVYFNEHSLKIKENQPVGVYGCSEVGAYGSTVHAHDGSKVGAHDGSTVHAYDGSTVHAYDGSTVVASKGSKVFAHDGSTVVAHDGSEVKAFDGSTVFASKDSWVEAYDSSSKVKAFDGSTVEAYDSSKVEAHDGSTVEAFDGSKVAAHKGSKVAARGSGVIVKAFDGATVKTYDGIVYATDKSDISRQGGRVVEWDGFSPVPGWDDDRLPENDKVPDTALATEDGEDESTKSIIEETVGRLETEEKQADDTGQDEELAAIAAKIKICKGKLEAQQIAEMYLKAKQFVIDDEAYNDQGLPKRNHFWYLLAQADCGNGHIRDIWNGLLPIGLGEDLGSKESVSQGSNGRNNIAGRIKTHKKKLAEKH